jgi:hypothetical protein
MLMEKAKKTKTKTKEQKSNYKITKKTSINNEFAILTKKLKLSNNINKISSNVKTKIYDKLFDDARRYIEEDTNFTRSTDIYLYLINNNYNKENITKWLSCNATDYDVRKYAFNNLLKWGKITDEDKLKMFIDMISNKSKYDFDMRQYDNVLQTINKMMDNEQLCNKIDLFYIIYYSDFNSPNWLNHIKYFCNAIQPYDNTYHPTLGNITADKLINLGIYTLYDQSPAFKHSIEVISFLSEIVPITLYVEGTTIDSKYDKYIKDKANLKIEFIGDKTDEELTNIMKKYNHIFLIFIYGFYKRHNVVLAHPAKYTFHYLDTYNIYTKRLYDFNIVDKYSYNYLKKYNPDVENEFGLVKLDVPVHMYPTCNECSIQRPKYNSDKIQIGLIINECKICDKIINIINKILSKNKNIFLTIYTYCDKTWLLRHFNKYHSRIDVKSYDNNNYMNELQNNLLYIDSVLYNGHSTSMEILKCNRPLIAFKNKSKYFGLVSSNIIKHIDMCNELCADTVDKYIELVLKHLKTKDSYYKLYDKFVANMEKSKILDNKHYAKELYNKLSELYKTLSLSFLNNYVPTNEKIPKQIWTYWDNDNVPDIVNNCIASWKKYNPNYKITLVNKNNIKKYITDIDIYGLKHATTPQLTSDFIRLYLLKKYGGFWVDASIILTQSLDFILDKQKEGKYELVGFYIEGLTNNSNYPVIENWFIATIPNSNFINLWYNTFLKINNYETPTDYTNKMILQANVDTQKIGEQLDYLTMHSAAQYVFQKLMTITYLNKNIFLFKAEDGPFKYLHGANWYHDKAFNNLLNDKTYLTPIIKLRNNERTFLENNQIIKQQLYKQFFDINTIMPQRTDIEFITLTNNSNYLNIPENKFENIQEQYTNQYKFNINPKLDINGSNIPDTELLNVD